MTRQIPMDRALSDEDRAYLNARGEHARVAQMDEAFGSLEVEEPDDGAEAGDDYDEWTVVELQAELGKRGLKKSGNQQELIARLREDDNKES